MQTFTLGGFEFEAPSVIGGGMLRRMVDAIEARYFSTVPSDQRRHVVEIVVTDADGNPVLAENGAVRTTTEAAVRRAIWFEQNASSYESTLLQLEMILTPCKGSPSVREAYELASPAEEEAVNAFLIHRGFGPDGKPLSLSTTPSSSDGTEGSSPTKRTKR